MFASIGKLLLGNGLAQALQFGSLLILSRVYQPSDFGLLATVQSIATVAAIVATLQLHLAIPLSKSADEARAAVNAVQSLVLLLVAAASPVLFWQKGAIAFALLLTLVLGLSNTYTSYFVFEGNFGRLSRYYVARAVIIILLQITLADARLPDVLTWATVMGEAMAMLHLRLWHLRGNLSGLHLSLQSARRMVSKWPAFSCYGTIQELVSVSSFYAPLLLFTHKFGSAVAGQYAMSSRIVWAPTILLSGSVAQVLYHRYGQTAQGEHATDDKALLPNKLIFAVLATCALPFLLQDVFLMILGAQWTLASRLLPIQILWGAIFLLSTPYRVRCRVLQLQHYQMYVDGCMLAAVLSVFAAPWLSIEQTMWGLAAIALAQNTSLALLVSSKAPNRLAAKNSA